MRFVSMLTAVGLLFCSGQVAAWGKAIWPFNTPYMVAKQICKNSEGWAISAVQSRRYNEQEELMQELRQNKAREIRNDPEYRLWHDIYYAEMTRFVRLVWRNPDVREEMAADIARKDCDSRIKTIQRKLEDTDPR